MSKTKQQNKYSKWLLTIQSVDIKKKDSGLPEIKEVIDFFNFMACPKYIFQLEIGETEKEHFQCAFMTADRVRQSTLIRKMKDYFKRDASQFQLNKQAGSWEENVKYCSKLKGRVGDNYYANFKVYDGSDLRMMLDKENRRPFQQSIVDMVLNEQEDDFLPADDRTIHWITDLSGGSGKSRVVKFFISKFPNRVASFTCNTDAQLRSAAIDASCRELIFVDLPRATKYQANYFEKMSNMLAVLEDIKNGCLSSAMYGKYRTLLCHPSHVFVFSNDPAPTQMLTNDRWEEYVLTPEYELKKTQDLHILFNKRAKDLGITT